MSNVRLPTISIVTPSYNQGSFLEETIQSVLEQAYPNVEYVIIDGASTDNSVEVIRKYENHLTYWVSEHDQGMYDALNKGFRHTNGEIMAWINSDDKYTPWAFQVVGDIFREFPYVEWITSCFPLTWNVRGHAVDCGYVPGYSRHAFWKGEYLPKRGWYARNFIQQESTFWRRSLWDRAGGHLDTSLNLAADFELWARFYQLAELVGVHTPLAGFRSHQHQKTHTQLKAYGDEAERVLRLYGGRPNGRFVSSLRRILKRVIPPRFGSLAQTAGLLHSSQVCQFNKVNETWTLADVVV